MTTTIVAIIAMLAIPNFVSGLGGSKDTIAQNLLEMANTAVHRFNQANYELNVDQGLDDTASVDLSIIRTLQYRNPLNPKIGSPYIKTSWNPVPSSNTSDYRLQWQGTLFHLLSPGDIGAGLKVNFEGGDLGTPYVFPSNFTMAGS